MKKIFVIGGAGYVGGGIVDKLKPKHNVTVYDSLIYENNPNITPTNSIDVKKSTEIVRTGLATSNLDRRISSHKIQ